MSTSSLDEISIIKRGRGKVMLYKGHQYYLHKRYLNGSSIWRCYNYKNNKCRGTETISEVTNSHIIICYISVLTSHLKVYFFIKLYYLIFSISLTGYSSFCVFCD